MGETAVGGAPLENWDASPARPDPQRVRVQARWVVALILLASAVVGLVIAGTPSAGAAGGCGGG